jgi:hypothetical protein
MIVAVFLFHHRLIVVVMGGFFLITMPLMVVRGGYPLPHYVSSQSFLSKQLPFLARASPM